MGKIVQKWVYILRKILKNNSKSFIGRPFIQTHITRILGQNNLTSDWPWLTPAWPLTPAMHYALVRGSSYQIGSHMTFLSNLTSGWIQLNPAWPLTPEMHYTLISSYSQRRYQVCPIIHCCNSTTPSWITASPILFYMVPCKEGNLSVCNALGKHQLLVKRNISFESYEWALFIKVALFTNCWGCVGTIVLWRCQKVMRTSWILILTHKCIHGLAPLYLQELIQEYKPTRNLRSSSKLNLISATMYSVNPYIWSSLIL